MCRIRIEGVHFHFENSIATTSPSGEDLYTFKAIDLIINVETDHDNDTIIGCSGVHYGKKFYLEIPFSTQATDDAYMVSDTGKCLVQWRFSILP